MSLIRKVHDLRVAQRGHRAENPLRRLICEQRWEAVDDMLSSDVSLDLSPFHDELILHLACKHNAPLKIIALLAGAFPSSIDAIDETSGRYPIHVAVASRCHPGVIGFLLKTSPESASIQDGRGKTPMHYAGHAMRCFDYYTANMVHHNAILIVELLAEAAPQSINVEDMDECNPIECAVLNNASIKVIKAMQRMSRRDWRTRGTKKH